MLTSVEHESDSVDKFYSIESVARP